MTTEEKQEEEKQETKPGSKRSKGKSSSAAKAKAKGSSAKSTRSKASSSKKSTPKRTRKSEAPPAEDQAPAEEQVAAVEALPPARLQVRFREEVAPALMTEFGYTSSMQVPRLDKIVVNMGLGEALENARALENATRDISLICGQRPVTTRARKSIAGFKIREGMPIGISATVRGRRMYEFFDRLVSSSLPRIRDFRGVSPKSFDGRGNYSLGIREHAIFPEIDYNTIDRIRGFQIVIATTARTDTEGMKLLELMGVPFARPEVEQSVA